ncbi:hypothetical protein E2986_09041 [Frieseomelitta varia]|uniref:Outer dense fiber protein 3 n=1 Tax=Frieseomelitta varia TaxID=561572 RepID=A0A833RKJ6_9HYME|nr:hypothetical protein E2986_09041 [Frieseomelitta varia]
MPPKADTQPKTKSEAIVDKKIGSLICGFKSPGPKYHLQTLVGYKEHCLSKYRNPAYTFGYRHPRLRKCEVPGPKYVFPTPKPNGFSFGLIEVYDKNVTSCGPGPKYSLPSPKGPAFTIKFRTKGRQLCIGPGPYNVKTPIPGPAFYMGHRLPGLKCDPTPSPKLYSDILVKQRVPAYHITSKRDKKIICASPGPKYYPKTPKPMPMFSFRIKHSECAPPYIVECDDQC